MTETVTQHVVRISCAVDHVAVLQAVAVSEHDPGFGFDVESAVIHPVVQLSADLVHA